MNDNNNIHKPNGPLRTPEISLLLVLMLPTVHIIIIIIIVDKRTSEMRCGLTGAYFTRPKPKPLSKWELSSTNIYFILAFHTFSYLFIACFCIVLFLYCIVHSLPCKRVVGTNNTNAI